MIQTAGSCISLEIDEARCEICNVLHLNWTILMPRSTEIRNGHDWRPFWHPILPNHLLWRCNYTWINWGWVAVIASGQCWRDEIQLCNPKIPQLTYEIRLCNPKSTQTTINQALLRPPWSPAHSRIGFLVLWLIVQTMKQYNNQLGGCKNGCDWWPLQPPIVPRHLTTLNMMRGWLVIKLTNMKQQNLNATIKCFICKLH